VASRANIAAPQKLPERNARQQLERILASAAFRPVDRLKRFLSFIVTEALEGRSDQLKEYVIGVQVFDKESSFDPRADPIVRVQARRLRARLVRYYREEGGADPIVIELPKGGYAPTFKQRDAGAISRRSIAAAFAGQNTIAVLPFQDHSQGRSLDYFCQGLYQELIHRLAKLDGLRVLVAPASDASGQDSDTPQGTSAALLLTGGIRKSGPRLRVTVHLIDSASASYLWSESVDTDAEDVLGAQETVAKAVVDKLEPRLMDGRERRGGRRPIENLAARNLYLQGRYHLNQRTDEGLQKAVEFFERAIVEDAQFALAHSGLADAFSLLSHYGVLEPAKVWTKAASAAAAAVMLDRNGVEAHTSLAHVKATQDWEWSGAEREFQLAITLDPSYPTAHHWYAMSCLVPLGRLDEALDEMRLAQSLDPVSSIVARDLAMVHAYRRDYEVALDQCDHAVELNPHFSPAYWALGFIQEQRKDFDEAIAAFQRAIHLSPQTPRMHAGLSRALALAGRREPAMTALSKIDALAKKRYVCPFEIASVRFALSQTEQGFRCLTKACKDRAFGVIGIRVDPRFEPLLGDSRFDSILREIGLPHELDRPKS
jgi:serine/threonine-protein kinase